MLKKYFHSKHKFKILFKEKIKLFQMADINNHCKIYFLQLQDITEANP